jgi:hypothetical protein
VAIGPCQVGGERYPAFARWAHPKQELVEEQLDQAILGTLRASYRGGDTVAVPGYRWGSSQVTLKSLAGTSTCFFLRGRQALHL